MEKPWCIKGDFNAIQYPSKRSEATRPSLAIYRWSNNRENECWSIIDRFVFSSHRE